MEKLFDTSKIIHDKITKKMIRRLKCADFKKVLDAGSGKVSASICLKYFPNADVDAVVYPGDNRKKNPLQTAIGSNRLEVVEADICSTTFRKKYDFCMVCLTLGEAHNFGNHFSDLFHQIMDIKAKYFLITDILDDPSVHYKYIEHYLTEKGFKILKKKKFRNPKPEKYPKVKYDKYKLSFVSRYFVSYLVEKL